MNSACCLFVVAGLLGQTPLSSADLLGQDPQLKTFPARCQAMLGSLTFHPNHLRVYGFEVVELFENSPPAIKGFPSFRGFRADLVKKLNEDQKSDVDHALAFLIKLLIMREGTDPPEAVKDRERWSKRVFGEHVEPIRKSLNNRIAKKMDADHPDRALVVELLRTRISNDAAFPTKAAEEWKKAFVAELAKKEGNQAREYSNDKLLTKINRSAENTGPTLQTMAATVALSRQGPVASVGELTADLERTLADSGSNPFSNPFAFPKIEPLQRLVDLGEKAQPAALEIVALLAEAQKKPGPLVRAFNIQAIEQALPQAPIGSEVLPPPPPPPFSGDREIRPVSDAVGVPNFLKDILKSLPGPLGPNLKELPASPAVETQVSPEFVAFAYSLARLGVYGKMALPKLREYGESWQGLSRLYAIGAIVAIDTSDEKTCDTLIRELESRDPKRQENVARVLGEITPKSARLLPPMLATLKASTNTNTQSYLIRAIGAIGPKADSAIDVLNGFMRISADAQGYDFRVPQAAAYALANMGEPGIQRILKVLDTEKIDPETALNVIFYFQALASAPEHAELSVPKLTAMLSAHQGSFASIAALALGQLGPRAASAREALIAAKNRKTQMNGDWEVGDMFERLVTITWALKQIEP